MVLGTVVRARISVAWGKVLMLLSAVLKSRGLIVEIRVETRGGRPAVENSNWPVEGSYSKEQVCSGVGGECYRTRNYLENLN